MDNLQDKKNDVVVKVPLKKYIELNEKGRRYDKMIEVINNRRTTRVPRSINIRGNNGYRVR